MRTDHAVTTLDRHLAEDLRATQPITRSLRLVPAPDTRRPAVTGTDPAGRRVTMITRVKAAVYGGTGDRLFYLLAAAVAGAVIAGIAVLEHRYPSELSGGVR